MRPSSPSTDRPAVRCTAPSSGRTAEPHRLCRLWPTTATSRSVRATTGLVLDPYFSATKAAWMLASRRPAARARRPPPRFVHGRHLGLVEPHRGTDGGLLRHRRHPTPAGPSSTTPGAGRGPTSCASSSGCRGTLWPRSAPRRALRQDRARAASEGAAPHRSSTGCRSAECRATSRPLCSARPASTPGMAKVTYGTGSFVLANVGPERPPAPRV